MAWVIVAITIGWYKGLEYHAVASAIANGTVELRIAKHLRKNEVKNALSWVDNQIEGHAITLTASDAPPGYVKTVECLVTGIREYRNQYPSARKMQGLDILLRKKQTDE